ncbi:bleomycin hydrolase [Rhodotorula sphaerocarpa]
MGSASSTQKTPTTTTLNEKRPAMTTTTTSTNGEDRATTAADAADMLKQLNLRNGSSRPSATITPDNLQAWEGDFASNPKHRLASTVLSKAAIADVLVRREAQLEAQQVFNVKLSTEGKPMTNQKSSGRCWQFSAFNYLRIMLARKLDLDEFQFSQAYSFFYDSLSKSNYFLENMLDLADQPLDDRLVQNLMSEPQNDGGQWDMLVNLLDMFGLVPQAVFPESTNSSATARVNSILTSKLREDAIELRSLHEAALRSLEETHKGRPLGERKALAAQAARKRKDEQLAEIYRILAITLGHPPKPDDTFVWEYYDKKASKFHRVESTPKQFYKDLGVDVAQALSLVNDPRHDYKSLLTVDRLGNVWGGRPVKYINVDVDVLKETAIKLLKADVPVWFDEALGIKLGMTKAQRLQTGESAMTHAMLLTAVNLDADGKPTRWRVENSWGEEPGDKGYFVMTDEWFSAFVYQIVADRKYISKELIDVFDHGEATVLPPWDPMGTLA